MNAFGWIVAAICAAVFVEDALPQRAIYHAGWYNVALLGLMGVLVVQTRNRARGTGAWSVAGLTAIALGAGIVGFAGVANGLLAPDPRSIVGAPGQEVAVADLGGDVLFPHLDASASGDAPELLRGGSSVSIGTTTYVGSFVLRPVPRTVVRVEAHDRGGAHLTITQPQGSVFLSPVLLMQQTQNISGLTLPYDSFALPAAHRIVKAVLFSAQQIAALRGAAGPPAPAVLFAVDDDADRPLPHSIRLARSGETVYDADVYLRGDVDNYPAIDVVAIPSLLACAIGVALIALGFAAVWRARSPSRS
jgi:hypothetical protein